MYTCMAAMKLITQGSVSVTSITPLGFHLTAFLQFPGANFLNIYHICIMTV